MKKDAALVATQTKMYMLQIRIAMVRATFALGLQDEASELATMAQDMIAQTGETYALSDLHRLQAKLAVADGDRETAERHLNTALDVARQQSAKLWELRAAIDLTRLWREQGRPDEATALLKSVYDSIADGDCPEDRTIARELLTV